MKSTLLVFLLLAPALLFGQSLAEVARKEKERREKNKKEGKEVHVISESDVGPAEEPAEGSSPPASTRPDSPSSSAGYRSESEMGDDGDGGDEEEEVPDFISPTAPLPEKLEMYERMKRGYQRQAAEIDEEIAKNETRLREIESELAVASAAGGAGLPVAPQPGVANRQMTGQESAALTGEQSRLQGENDRLRRQKEQLKLDVQGKGRAAGIPPGYLRF